MTLKERFAEIGRLLALKFEVVPPVPAPAPVVPVDYPLADGQVLTIDTLAVGGVVTISGMPAPDGEYTLADKTIVQTQGGIIAELSSPVEDAIPEEMKTTDAVTAAMSEDIKNLKATIEKMKAEIGSFSQNFNSAKEENTTLRNALVEMNAVVEEIGKGLVEEPIEKQEPAVLTAFQKHTLKHAPNV